MENSYKTDPPITIPEFSENKFENIFFENINPKNPKNTPKNKFFFQKHGKIWTF